MTFDYALLGFIGSLPLSLVAIGLLYVSAVRLAEADEVVDVGVGVEEGEDEDPAQKHKRRRRRRHRRPSNYEDDDEDTMWRWKNEILFGA